MPRAGLQEAFTGSHAIAVPEDVLDQLIPQLERAELLVLVFLIRQKFGHGRELVPICEIEGGVCTPESPARDLRLSPLGIRRTCAGMARKGILVVREVSSDTRESLYGLRSPVDTRPVSSVRRYRATTRKPASRHTVEELRRLGLSPRVALTVMISAPAESIQAQIAALPLRRSQDPGTTLVRAVIEQWALPQDFNPDLLDPAPQAVPSPGEALHRQRVATSLVKSYLALLREDEREELERQARDRIRATGGEFFVPEVIPRSTLDYFVRAIALERMISSLEAAVPRTWPLPQDIPPELSLMPAAS